MRSHTGEKPFACDVCPSKFARRDVLKTHERKHSEQREFSCNKCEKNIKINKVYRFTNEIIRVNDLLFVQYVVRVSQEKKELRTHKKNNLPKKHWCTICGIVYQDKNLFDKHVNTHSLQYEESERKVDIETKETEGDLGLLSIVIVDEEQGLMCNVGTNEPQTGVDIGL